MFGGKKCPSCREKVKDEWNFCPHCGEEIVEKSFDIRDMDKELKKMEKLFGFSEFKPKSFEKGGGINIIIRNGTGFGPRIEIKTSGEYKKIEPMLKKKFGITEEKQEKKVQERIPKVTEEPRTEVKIVGNRQVVSIKLPGVKSEDDVSVKKLEQSLEVKAFVGDKAYFTLVPIPKGSSIVSKEFKEGTLKLELER